MPRTSNPGHLTKHFNTQIFEAFTADLGKYIDQGLPDAATETNRQWLQDMTAAASMIPDAELRGKRIQQRCEAVAAEFDQWNARNGTRENRAAHQRRMRRSVDKVARSYRRRTELLEEKTDPRVYLAFYQATEKLVRALPDTYSEVPERFAKYPKPAGATA
ncbi:MAG: hypothetical protein V7642_3681 [Burkholderiales bacterium]|jgi:hypothetical protein